MNRQEAIIVMRDTNWSRMMVDWSYTDRCRVLDAIIASLAALRVPEPNPDTGLVPRGCGGKAGFHYSVMMRDNDCYVECGICGGHTKVVLSEDEAREAWNTPMDWKGGAE